jgi:ribonuclease HI
MRGSVPEVKDPDFPGFFQRYKYQKPVCDMADWMVHEGLASFTEEEPNTTVFVKVKPDGTKLQVIADASLRNKSIAFSPKNFVLFSPEHAKPVLREPGPTSMWTFDISNFFHAFVLPQWFHENIPVILRIPESDGVVRSLRCRRAAFGDKFSPVLTHQALSDLLDIPSTVYTKGVDPRPHPCPGLNEKEDASGVYIDDIIEFSKVKPRGEARYLDKRDRIASHRMPVKQKSVHEGVEDVDFAGKRYSGVVDRQFIANTRKNSAKLVAIAMQVLTKDEVHPDDIRSLIGSFAYGTCHHKQALPFLSGVSLLAAGEGKPAPLSHTLKLDVAIALQISLSPWSPDSEMRWNGFQENLPVVVVDASVKDSLVGIFLFHRDECWVGSFSIPTKFAASQQSAELYGVFIALKWGWERFREKFNLISDSASSVSSVTKFKMSSLPKARNSLIRKIVRWGFMRNMRVSMSWTDTKHNLADIPSREVFKPINEFQTYPVGKFSTYLVKAKPFFLSSHAYSQK